MFRVGDRTLPGQLVGLLPVFAAALTISLAGDRPVTAAGGSDFSRGQDQIYVRKNVVDAVTVVFDATRMHNHGGLCASIELRGFDNSIRGHAGNFRGDMRWVPGSRLTCGCPVVRARVDK